MKKAPDPKIFYILAGVAVLGGGLLDYFQFSHLSDSESRVQAVQEEVDKAETIKKDLATSEAALQELQVKLAHLERGVQSFQYIPKMLKELEEFGKSQGVTITGVRPQIKPPTAKPDSKETRKPYDELVIELKGRGTYADVLRFLDALQQFPQIVAVRTVSLTPKTEGDKATTESPKLDMVAEVKVFIFPETNTQASTTGSAVATVEGANNG
jgi:Tfp pilus assembly protein PilO